MKKHAQSAPLNRTSFSTIKRIVKMMRGMKRRDIKQLAARPDVLKFFPSYTGKLSDPAFRKTVFPRRSLFRGSDGVLAGGNQTSDGILAEDLVTLPKTLHQNATPVPNYARMYGPVTNVWNARKVPGALTGTRSIAGDRMMYGYLQDGDPTKPLSHSLFFKGNRSLGERRMRSLDSHSPSFNWRDASERGETETLIDTVANRPQRVYSVGLARKLEPGEIEHTLRYRDVTPLDRFFRAIPDSPTAAVDRENIQTLLRSLAYAS